MRANPAAAPARLIDAWRARVFGLVLSQHILVELDHTLEDRYFRQRLSPERVARSRRLLRTRAEIVPLTAEVHGVATHPEDDVVLATAVSAEAEYLVTGDSQLQLLGNYAGVAIVSPAAFLQVLTSEGGRSGQRSWGTE